MYYPYFRGKQNELILIREQAELISNSKIIPIIEPVKRNLSPLNRAIEQLDLSKYADNYFDLKFSLEEILKREIDLLEEKSIKNPYFLEVVNHQKQLIYG